MIVCCFAEVVGGLWLLSKGATKGNRKFVELDETGFKQKARSFLKNVKEGRNPRCVLMNTMYCKNYIPGYIFSQDFFLSKFFSLRLFFSLKIFLREIFSEKKFLRENKFERKIF